ncbi:MAG: peptidylprolyl isomerase [Burkholderiaceae bacterium]|jgi:peptidyl-prolyl cis-trans isomerase C
MKRIVTLAAALTLSLPVWAAPIATVNGQEIQQKQVDEFVALLAQQGVPDTPELRERVKEELVNRLIMVQAAEKAGITKDAEVQQELELARQGILVRALMANYLEKNPITDAQIKAEYDKLKEAQSKELEYKLRHILVKEKAEAEALIADLKSGKQKFEAAAKEKSQDPGSGQNGGDLGWGPVSNYVPEFAGAVSSMKKGDLTSQPVQTQFGWHIIQVDDTRQAKFPEMEEVKPQLEEMLRKQMLSQYQEKLIKEATVK